MATPTTDNAAIRSILLHLVQLGYSIVGHSYHRDCERGKLSPAHCADFLTTQLDEGHVYLEKNGVKYRLFFVMGNAPYEVLCDYSAPTEEGLVNLTDDINSLCDKWDWE